MEDLDRTRPDLELRVLIPAFAYDPELSVQPFSPIQLFPSGIEL